MKMYMIDWIANLPKLIPSSGTVAVHKKCYDSLYDEEQKALPIADTTQTKVGERCGRNIAKPKEDSLRVFLFRSQGSEIKRGRTFFGFYFWL